MSQHIQKVEIKNFKSIESKTVDLHGKNVYVVGGNGEGKTGFIDAAFGMMPNKPLRNGAHKGQVKIELDEFLIEFNFSEKNQKPKLVVYDRSGVPQKEPATLLKRIFGIKDFNIDEFLSLSDAKQVEKIKSIVGIDWTDVDARFKELYEERRFLNRQAKELDAKVDGTPYDPNLKPVDVSDLTSKLEEANKTNAQIERIINGCKEKSERCAAIMEEMKLLQDELDKTNAELKKGEKWLEDRKVIDTSDIIRKIDQAAEINAKVAANEENKKIREQSSIIWTKISDIEREMQTIKDQKAEELKSAQLPVKGLSFDEDKLYLDNLPFKSDQINTARRIVAGLEMQFEINKRENTAENPVLIARFDGSLLDKESIKEVEEWANLRNVQLFVELVDRDGGELKIEVNES